MSTTSMAGAAPDPVLVSLGARQVALRWSARAEYRLATVRPRVTLDDARHGGGLDFLIAHLWAMLADEADRRRFPDPEALAAAVDIRAVDTLKALWRTVLLQGYDFDPDAPPPEPDPAAAAADEPPEEVDAGGQTGTKP